MSSTTALSRGIRAVALSPSMAEEVAICDGAAYSEAPNHRVNTIPCNSERLRRLTSLRT